MDKKFPEVRWADGHTITPYVETEEESKRAAILIDVGEMACELCHNQYGMAPDRIDNVIVFPKDGEPGISSITVGPNISEVMDNNRPAMISYSEEQLNEQAKAYLTREGADLTRPNMDYRYCINGEMIASVDLKPKMQPVTLLMDAEKQKQTYELNRLDAKDLCEMIHNHFESHPTLPGEKALKTAANNFLNETAEGKNPVMTDKQKLDMAKSYADTRIRSTKLILNTQGSKPFEPDKLKLDKIDPADYKDHADPYVAKGRISVYETTVELQRREGSKPHVSVLAPLSDGSYQTIGALPPNFLTNSPMNVEYCEGKLQVTDYSNGKLNNVSTRLIVDSDLMSGDVIDLNEDMLEALGETEGLQQ